MNSDKVHSWGVKVFTRAGISGVVYDIDIYTRQGTVAVCTMGQGGYVELCLAQNIPKIINYRVFFDNFYTFFEFIENLRDEYEIDSCGVIRSNRLGEAVLSSDSKTKK
ncbi:hypothetical protein QYM36_007820 [Artemia franciscana]|uniref:PiggyBac transposable element-derived protein domain-containing protein n=1 Tax=Artemia franciscana TaxID=6661 RepID=A0AA88IHQ0_ARTSF|nr:hypothetical protein QYM36_007820 [Artemia franciscana]